MFNQLLKSYTILPQHFLIQLPSYVTILPEVRVD